MKVTAASVIALIASASATSYQWVGRPTNFNDALNWQPYDGVRDQGISPVGSRGSQPSEVHVGRPNDPALTVVVDPNAGNQDYMVGRMIQFDGSATLILGDGVEGSTTTLTFDASNSRASNAITFTADDQFDCSSNWVLQGGDTIDRTASDAACPVPTNADTVMLGPSTGTAPVRINFASFSVDNFLYGPSGICLDNGNFATNDRVTAMFSTGCNRQTSGGGRGDACSVSADTCRDTDDQDTADIASATTASSADDGGGDSTIIIAVIIGACVLIAVVIGVVFILVKNQSGGVDDRGQVSFENPMYDQTGKPQQQQNATYSEPGGGSSGYMDVPAGGGGGGSGYMDVAPTGGYMDVAPNQGTTGYMDVSAGFDDDDAEDV